MSAQTPTGSYTIRLSTSGIPVSTTRSVDPAETRLPKYRKQLAMSSMSYALSTSRFPVSSDSARAKVSLSRSSSSATRSSSRPRSAADVLGQGPSSKARRAAATAAPASLGPPSSTVATGVPSAGQRISRVPPSAAAVHRPPMNSSGMGSSWYGSCTGWGRRARHLLCRLQDRE